MCRLCTSAFQWVCVLSAFQCFSSLGYLRSSSTQIEYSNVNTPLPGNLCSSSKFTIKSAHQTSFEMIFERTSRTCPRNLMRTHRIVETFYPFTLLNQSHKTILFAVMKSFLIIFNEICSTRFLIWNSINREHHAKGITKTELQSSANCQKPDHIWNHIFSSRTDDRCKFFPSIGLLGSTKAIF